MHTSSPPRPLTLDERRAAEAAFSGKPFDPKWSEAARAVYEGIANAMGPRAPLFEGAAPERFRSQQTAGTAQPAKPAGTDPGMPSDSQPGASSTPMMTREEAVQAGYLIDVTPIAQRVGLPVPVCFSKALWDYVITASHTLPDEQHESRVQGVLTALRLHLATIRAASPAIAFPALLPFPSEPVPQLCQFFAIAIGDLAVPSSLTILLANEVSAVIQPTGN
jgi:hypothetical protein